jgi:hypothetical protein
MVAFFTHVVEAALEALAFLWAALAISFFACVVGAWLLG